MYKFLLYKCYSTAAKNEKRRTDSSTTTSYGNIGGYNGRDEFGQKVNFG